MDIEAEKGEALVFAGSLMQQVNTDDVANMVQVQRGMLQRFEKTNEMLINFNQLSYTRYEASVKDFQEHTQLLYDMKKDLDSIFKRIRSLKQRLSKSYPEAFAACSSVIMMEEEDNDDDTTTSTTTTTTTQPAPHTQPTTQTPSPPHSRASRKPVDGDGSASKTRSVHSRKSHSKSCAARKEHGGSGQTIRKSSRSAAENDQKFVGSGASSGQSQPK